MGTIQPSSRTIGRRMTPARVAYRRMAETAEIGTVTRGQLVALARNLTCIGLIRGAEAHLLEAIINTAPAEAFDEGGRPLVFKSNAEFGWEIDRSEGRVSRMLSRLYDIGLITMNDSGNYKRYPVRSASGKIIDGCGIDLRIFVARYQELHDQVRLARDEHKATVGALKLWRGSLRNLRGALSNATNLHAGLRKLVENRLERILQLVGTTSKAPAALLRRATRLIDWLMARLMNVPQQPKSEGRSSSETAKSTCTDVEIDMQIQNTSPDQSVNCNHKRSSANASQPTSSEAGKAGQIRQEKRMSLAPAQIRPTSRPTQATVVALEDVIRASPFLAEYGYERPRRWTDLDRLTPALCRLAGISDDARNRAVETLGRQGAAIAVSITVQKQLDGLVSSPGGYLRAMTDRAKTGQLNLAASVFGLIAQHTPEPLQ